MIKTTLTVRCVLGHEREVHDRDGNIRLQGYTRCYEPECERNAWVVKISTHDNIHPAWRHLEVATVCPHCGESLE